MVENWRVNWIFFFRFFLGYCFWWWFLVRVECVNWLYFGFCVFLVLCYRCMFFFWWCCIDDLIFIVFWYLVMVFLVIFMLFDFSIFMIVLLDRIVLGFFVLIICLILWCMDLVECVFLFFVVLIVEEKKYLSLNILWGVVMYLFDVIWFIVDLCILIVLVMVLRFNGCRYLMLWVRNLFCCWMIFVDIFKIVWVCWFRFLVN